jgi:glycosyltransferase involved in cell wall biosynthesis
LDTGPQPRSPRHVVVLNWRDTQHPEGGGSEVYVERLAHGLAAQGDRVTILCAAVAGRRRVETHNGVTFVRRGGHLTVYLWAALLVVLGRLGPLGRSDVIIEVQNGMPFLARLYARCPVVVLVHHVHKEQWHVVGPVLARIGWFLESRVAPVVNRGSRYVAVSNVTAAELEGLGVGPEQITVAFNGILSGPEIGTVPRSATPHLVVLGRLVPHKRAEHAIDVVKALRDEIPDLTLAIVGSGWWEDELREYAANSEVADRIEFLGHVDEATKHRELARAWALVLPSVKEGWGLVIIEAAVHGTPSIAYRSAGGVRESIQDGVTGLLADDARDLVDMARSVLCDHELRQELGAKAALRAEEFDWQTTIDRVADILSRPVQTTPDRHPVAVGHG